jgi:phosphopantothenoylcysteine decarboxylase/phosphopantothenate--cysteine ligase
MRKALTFLITAGPTVEDLDPVRFISNRASGRLGFEIARAALAAGERVILVHGPVAGELVRSLPRVPAARLRRVAVRSCAQMHRAVLTALPLTDVVVMTAAVADFTPARVSPVKLKKNAAGLALRLKPTVDILARLGRVKRTQRPGLRLIGFALETGAGRTPAARLRARLREARRKLAAKNLDALVLDTPAEMAAARGEFHVLRAGTEEVLRFRGSKWAFARSLVAGVRAAGGLPRTTKPSRRGVPRVPLSALC